MINKRKDEYGGSALNRARIIFEIIEEIKIVAKNTLISLRLPISDNPPMYKFFDNGLTAEEGLLIGKELSFKLI